MRQFRRFAVFLAKLVDKTATDITGGFLAGMRAFGFVPRWTRRADVERLAGLLAPR